MLNNFALANAFARAVAAQGCERFDAKAAPSRTISVSFKVPEQLLADILTTAIEGGIGYWARVRRVHHSEDRSVLSCQIREVDSDGMPISKPVPVTLDTIAAGIQRVLAMPAPCRTDIADAVRNAVGNPDEADIDAEAADVILQLAVLGEVRYS